MHVGQHLRVHFKGRATKMNIVALSLSKTDKLHTHG